MKLQPTVPLRIVCRTPVYVGSGETWGPLSYVAGGGRLRVVNPEGLFRHLGEARTEAYLRWLEPLMAQVAGLDEQLAQAREARNRERIRALSGNRTKVQSQLSLALFLKEKAKLDPNALPSECFLYDVKLPVNLSGRGEVRASLKDARQRAYLPGTELKGALRTALLEHLLATDPERYAAFRDDIAGLPGKTGEKRAKEALKEVWQAVEDRELRSAEAPAGKGPNYDFFKFVTIGDTTSIPASELVVEETAAEGTGRMTTMYLETLPLESMLRTTLTLGDPGQLAGLGLNHLASYLSVKDLLVALQDHAERALERESAYFQDVQAPGPQQILRKLRELNRPESPLLRVGAGQGYLSTTVTGPLLDQDPELFEEPLRTTLDSAFRHWKTYPDNFPKTRRTVREGGQRDSASVDLLGWIQVIPEGD